MEYVEPQQSSPKKPSDKKSRGAVIALDDSSDAGANTSYCLFVWRSITVTLIHVLIGAVCMAAMTHTLMTGDSHVFLCTCARNTVYCQTVLCAIIVAICTMLRAATLMCLFMYCLHTGFQDLHVLLCSFAFQFFTAEAILSFNSANGWSVPMKKRHKTCAHIFLQICSLACSVTGTVLVFLDKGLALTAHAITGMVTMSFVGVGIICGSLTFLPRKVGFYFKLVHMGFGILTLFTAAICLILGMLNDSFKNWTNHTVSYILIGFVPLYTAFILASVFIKCVSRL